MVFTKPAETDAQARLIEAPFTSESRGKQATPTFAPGLRRPGF